jgi:hypothetical protein
MNLYQGALSSYQRQVETLHTDIAIQRQWHKYCSVKAVEPRRQVETSRPVCMSTNWEDHDPCWVQMMSCWVQMSLDTDVLLGTDYVLLGTDVRG